MTDKNHKMNENIIKWLSTIVKWLTKNKKLLSTVAKMAYSERKTSPGDAHASSALRLPTGEGHILICLAPLPPAPLPSPPLHLTKWLMKHKMTEEITKSPMKHKMTEHYDKIQRMIVHYGKILKMNEQKSKNDWRKS
jgi:hypothetical protein